jgi:hypothetical protein
LNVGHKELKDRPVPVTLFDVQTERTGLEAHEGFAPVRHWQAKNRPIKLCGLRPSIGSDNDITRRSKFVFHRNLRLLHPTTNNTFEKTGYVKEFHFCRWNDIAVLV